MTVSRRPSSQTVRVLGALASDPLAWRYGYELGGEVGLRSGSLYPILVRLADRGLLDATWEADSARRPPPAPPVPPDRPRAGLRRRPPRVAGRTDPRRRLTARSAS